MMRSAVVVLMGLVALVTCQEEARPTLFAPFQQGRGDINQFVPAWGLLGSSGPFEFDYDYLLQKERVHTTAVDLGLDIEMFFDFKNHVMHEILRSPDGSEVCLKFDLDESIEMPGPKYLQECQLVGPAMLRDQELEQYTCVINTPGLDTATSLFIEPEGKFVNALRQVIAYEEEDVPLGFAVYDFYSFTHNRLSPDTFEPPALCLDEVAVNSNASTRRSSTPQEHLRDMAMHFAVR